MRSALLTSFIIAIAAIGCGETPSRQASDDDLEIFARETANAGGDLAKACGELERLCREKKLGCSAHELFCKHQDVCQLLKHECDGGAVEACKLAAAHCQAPGPHPDAGARPDKSTMPPVPAPDASTRPDKGTMPPVPAPDSSTTPPPSTTPPGGDTQKPFPIDRGDESASTPGSYKGLPLRLTDNGAPQVSAVDGVIGVVCIGMSNSNQECGHYITQLASKYAGQVNKAVRVVNCAVGGHAIEKWIDPQYDGTLWTACIEKKLQQAGVRKDQVRVLYHKAADMFTAGSNGQVYPPYPDPNSDYHNFQKNLSAFAGRVKKFFPAVQAVYSSSRIYGGFSSKPTRGEPLSYEEGHALNGWLAKNNSVDGVWYGWGPYLWAGDCNGGEKNASGTCYVRADFQADGVHPATGARDKVADLIHARLSRESWYTP